MNLLITPALKLNKEQELMLSENNVLYYISDERVPISKLNIEFNLDEIDGIICNFFFLNNPLSILPNLKFIQLTSVGYDRVPIEEIRNKGIVLHNAGSSYAVPMAEWTVAKILEVYKCSKEFYDFQGKHEWHKIREIKELFGSEISIIGFGNLGREIAKRIKPFGVKVTAVDIFEFDDSMISDNYVHFSYMSNALSNADVVVLCLPLNDSTFHLFDDNCFSKLKSGSLLINLARGELIDTSSLIKHINADENFFFVSDVFETEPLPKDFPLWDMDRVIITPHNSFVGNNNKTRLFSTIYNNIKNYGV